MDDDVQVDDDFNSGTITLSYDDAGNLTLDTAAAASRPRSRCDRRALLELRCQGLTADGVYQYVYDAWNP